VERTFDWYAQDKDGNVWYMGEDSFELKGGRFVKASDSWKSGVDGAQPGIIMPANPQPGEAYRQEYYPPGEALDEARVLNLNGSAGCPTVLQRVARDLRAKPARTADRTEVLRPWARGDRGARRPGASRGVSTGQRDVLIAGSSVGLIRFQWAAGPPT
jgi:hypothetical protein